MKFLSIVWHSTKVIHNSSQSGQEKSDSRWHHKARLSQYRQRPLRTGNGFQSGIVFRSIGSYLKNYTCLFQFYFRITADPVEIGVVRSPSLWVTQVWRRVFIWDFIDWFDSMKYLFYACRKHLRSWIFKVTWPQRVFIVFPIPFVGQVNGPQEPNTSIINSTVD